MADVPGAVVGARDEVPDHLLGVLEVGDHTAAQRTHRDDVRRGPAEHPACLSADAQNLAGALADRDDRWLIEDDAAAAHMNQRVGRPEVDADIGRPEPQHGGQQTHCRDVERSIAKARDGADHTPRRGAFYMSTPYLVC